MNPRFKVCNCNRTMPLNAVSGQRLGELLHAPPLLPVTQLCGRDTGAFEEAIQGIDPVVVGCTQESPLFKELADEGNSVAPLRFVNLRETAGWGAQSYSSLPKMAALLAEATLPDPEPTPEVRYVSQGRLLIIGSAAEALQWAEQLHDQLQATVLITDSMAGTLPLDREYPTFSGSDVKLEGWLGAFAAEWKQGNPIDLDLCVRCGACVAACPEQAINLLYQVDEEKCGRHGDCVQACGATKAIDFTRAEQDRRGEFDLVLDLGATPLLSMHQPPYGYFTLAAADARTQVSIALQITQMIGTFEKPTYFQYKERLCAHSRNQQAGCSACIDICSTAAIRSDGDHIKVEPHLCAGCGACTTVCPSGALRYAYPTVPHIGKRMKTLLSVYKNAGGEQAALLLHDRGDGARLIGGLGRLAQAGRNCRGMPARMIPLALHHIASAGLDVWLSALCYGATNVVILLTGSEAPDYRHALQQQLAIAQEIMAGLGYAGRHFSLVDARSPQELDAALHAMHAAEVPKVSASFDLFSDKRNTLDFIFTHLCQHAPAMRDEIALPAGAPFGTLDLDKDVCTLCMACAGACPASALMTTPDLPRLRFVERNCIQCGICVATCPERAISLVPRLALHDAAKTPVVLNETEPFNCIRCNKPIGTVKLVKSMLAKLGGHGAFAGNTERLKMCGDCRVIDMMGVRHEPSVTDLPRQG